MGAMRRRLPVVAVAAVAVVAPAGSGGAVTASVPAKAVAAGLAHSCALTSAGVKCWGVGSAGQLGDGSTVDRSTPVGVSGLSSHVAAIAVGVRHSCALTTSGAVKCWGHNGFGQLGDGAAGYRVTPVDVAGLGSGVTAIAAGFDHTCALTTGGGVKCWGYNGEGHLGDGTTTNRSTPVDVVGLSSGVAAISLGGHSCALTRGGGLKCWGSNRFGQLGDGTTGRRLAPVDVSGLSGGVTAIAAGVGHTCALTSGGVKCWGDNDAGELGDGTTTSRSTPVDVSGLGTGVTAVVAGAGHSCALTRAGAARCWGQNESGQLGDGTTTNRSTPGGVSGLSSGVTSLASTTAFHNCALVRGGGVKCWGSNSAGQLGDRTTSNRSTPVGVSGLGAAKATLAIASRSVAVTPSRVAAIELRCGAAARCRGTLTLTASISTGRVPVRLGSRAFSIGAGGTRVVGVRLTARSFALLAAAGRLHARARVGYVQPAGGTTIATRTVTLRAPKAG